MGFVEGILTAIGMTVSYLVSQDATTALMTGILCVVFFMKGDKE